MSWKRRRLGPLTLLARYSLHVWLVIFLANFGLYYTFRFGLLAQECMTPEQVQSDSRCLYIYNESVYEIGTKSNPHMGHPCGSEPPVPSFHIADVAKYMDPRRVTSVCENPPPEPTATPVPQPTATPVPQPTATPVPQPTNPPASPTSAPNPSATPQVTQPVPTATPVVAPTEGQQSVVPSPTSAAGVDPTQAQQQTGFGGMMADGQGDETGALLEEEMAAEPMVSPTPAVGIATTELTPESGNPVETVWLSLKAIMVEQHYLELGWWVRFLGLAGLLGLGLTMALGFSRMPLIKRFGRKKVMWGHYIAGVMALVGILGHMGLLWVSQTGYGYMVSLQTLLVPRVADNTAISFSLGVLAFWLLLLVLVSGVFFRRISKRFGYRVWDVMHLSSLLVVILVFVHGLRIGTDFRNSLIAGMFWLLFLYTLWQFNKSIWRLFNRPRPAASGEEVKQAGKGEEGEIVEKTLYVVPKVQDESGKAWWVTLSDGVQRMWGYYNTEAVKESWMKVKGVRKEIGGVPYVMIGELGVA